MGGRKEVQESAKDSALPLRVYALVARAQVTMSHEGTKVQEQETILRGVLAEKAGGLGLQKRQVWKKDIRGEGTVEAKAQRQEGTGHVRGERAPSPSGRRPVEGCCRM